MCRQGEAPPLTHVVGLREGDDVNAAVADDGADAELAVVGLVEEVHVPVLKERDKREGWVSIGVN